MPNPESDSPRLPVNLRRAISSVVGVALMIAIVVVLSSVIAGMVFTFDDKLREPELTPTDTSASTNPSLNPWDDDDQLLAPEDPAAGAEDVRYRVVFEIQPNSDTEGDSLNELKISVDNVSESMFSGVEKSDIDTFEVEKADGTELDIKDDVQDESNWAFANGDTEIEMVLGGDYSNPAEGDVITVIFDDVDNPNDPGTYDLSVTLNQDGESQDGTLEIISS